MTRSLVLPLLLVLSAPLATGASAQSALDALSSTPGFERASPASSPSAPSSGQPPFPDYVPPPVPADGGLALLALAGAGYAARRLRAGRMDKPKAPSRKS